MRSEMQCGSIWWRMHPSDFTNTPADFMLLSPKLLSGTMGHRAQLQRQEEEGGLGLLGGVRQGTESLAWLPVGIPNAFRAWSLIAWCLTQSLFLKGSWQTNDFFFSVELSEYTYFKFVVWCSEILKLYAKSKETCLEMHYPRDTEAAFWQAAALPANTW